MKYEEAAKKVRDEKPKENFMVIEFGYENKFLLPHKHGVAVLDAMANAERLQEGYGEPKRILELPRDAVISRLMSSQEYARFKIAALLNVTPEEVKEAQDKAREPQDQPSP